MQVILGLMSLFPLSALASSGSANRTRSLRFRPEDLLQEVAIAPNSPAAASFASATIEFFYGPECGHCLDFMRKAIIPLLEAGLPGDRVKLSVLPFIRLEHTPQVDLGLWDQVCRETNLCYYALAPLCALKANVPGPMNLDSPELAKAVRFAECNQARRLQSHANTPMEVSQEMQIAEDAESRQCAAQTGLTYDGPGGIKECADGPESVGLIHAPGYTGRVLARQDTLKQSGKQMMPYIFLNGNVLRCDESDIGVDCSGIWSPAFKDQLLPEAQRGTLLHLVCSKLVPQPPACAGVSDARVKVGPTAKCENCVEVGSFHWQEPQQSLAPWGYAAGLALSAAVLGWVAMRFVSKTRHSQAASDLLVAE